MKLLLPDQVCNRVTDIDLDVLRIQGISCLLLDLDNTLVQYDSDRLDSEFRLWIEEAKAKGFRVCLVSNGKPKRVKRFAEEMDIPAVIWAFKPKRTPFRKALRILGKKVSEAAMIGDQLFTDILGANRLGIYSILITPLGTKELGTTRVVRKLERRMLKKFVKKGMLTPEAVNQRDGGKE